MSEPFRVFSAVMPIILKTDSTGTKILLHRRQNTGYQDGKLDIAASGHVDYNETAVAAVVRECKEELGIDVNANDVSFAHLQHRLARRIYYDIYFVVHKFHGTPHIVEPDKCSELVYHNLDNLPDDIIECRKIGIQEYLKANYYSEVVETLFE